MYGYANPLRFVDPTGHEAGDLWDPRTYFGENRTAAAWQGFSETAANIANPANYDWGVFASDIQENAGARLVGVGEAAIEASTDLATESFFMAGDTVNLAVGRDVPLASKLAQNTLERMGRGESTGDIIQGSAVDIGANVLTVGMYGTAKEYGSIITDFSTGQASIQDVEERLQASAGQSALNAGLGAAASKIAGSGWMGPKVQGPRALAGGLRQTARDVSARAKVVAESASQIPGRAGTAWKRFQVQHGMGSSKAARASSKRYFDSQKRQYWRGRGPNTPRVNPAFPRNLEFDELHHWAIPRNRWGKYVPNEIKHGRLNLVRTSGTKHARLDSFRGQFIKKGFRGLPEFAPFGLGGQLLYGTPTWAKIVAGAGLAGGAYLAYDSLKDLQ